MGVLKVWDEVSQQYVPIVGARGPAGPQGEPGAPGEPGAQGPAGPGVPAGGTEGQMLIKASDSDHDAAWVNPPMEVDEVWIGVEPVDPEVEIWIDPNAEPEAGTGGGGAKEVWIHEEPPVEEPDIEIWVDLDDDTGGIAGGGEGSSWDEADARYINVTGDTMIGPLSVPSPTESHHVATKGYVDDSATPPEVSIGEPMETAKLWVNERTVSARQLSAPVNYTTGTTVALATPAGVLTQPESGSIPGDLGRIETMFSAGATPSGWQFGTSIGALNIPLTEVTYNSEVRLRGRIELNIDRLFDSVPAAMIDQPMSVTVYVTFGAGLAVSDPLLPPDGPIGDGWTEKHAYTSASRILSAVYSGKFTEIGPKLATSLSFDVMAVVKDNPSISISVSVGAWGAMSNPGLPTLSSDRIFTIDFKDFSVEQSAIDVVDMFYRGPEGFELLANGEKSTVQRKGDTMIGPLTLSGDPEKPLGAATKAYVDNRMWFGTREQYNALPTKAAGVLYVLTG
jgi:hypothetical protein